MKKQKYQFNDLLSIMEKLRSEDGCPWDKEQTHDSLKKYLIEEAYEVVDAIESDDRAKQAEELGDVLLQIVFQSQLGKEEGAFDISNVITSICEKMIHRHPHVFGQDKLSKSHEVEVKWDQIKNKDRGISTITQNLEEVPRHFPALMRSYKIQKKAADAGFDWDNIDDAFKKVYEEIDEVKEAQKAGEEKKIFEEVGDLIFSVVNVSRKLGVEPETALCATIKKFIDRFRFVEESAQKSNKKLNEMSLNEMDSLWKEAKKKTK